MSATLVLAAHGSRDPRFDATARRVADAVRVALPGVRVELAYLDLNTPLIGDVLAGLSGEVVVVPLLFGNGFHGKVDLPALLAEASTTNRSLSVSQTRIVGVCSPVPALVDRLADAGLRDDDGVLMIAVGSSDPTSDASIEARADELGVALGQPVELVFATRIGPDGAAIRAAVDRLIARGCDRIALSPLFLSAGLLTERVESVLDTLDVPALVAGPVGAHPVLVDAVAHVYTSVAPVSV